MLNKIAQIKIFHLYGSICHYLDHYWSFIFCES